MKSHRVVVTVIAPSSGHDHLVDTFPPHHHRLRSIKSCIRCCDEHQIYSDIYFSVATKLQRCSDEIFDAFYTHDSTMVVGHHHQQPPPPQQRHLGAVDTTNTDSSSSFMLARSCQLLVNVHKLMSCFGNALQELFEALQLLVSSVLACSVYACVCSPPLFYY